METKLLPPGAVLCVNFMQRYWLWGLSMENIVVFLSLVSVFLWGTGRRGERVGTGALSGGCLGPHLAHGLIPSKMRAAECGPTEEIDGQFVCPGLGPASSQHSFPLAAQNPRLFHLFIYKKNC